MECSEVQRQLWSEDRPAALEAHLEGCADCRREERRMGEMRSVLVDMRDRVATVPASLEADLLAVLSRSPLQRAREVVYHPKFWRGAAVGAAAATAAAFGLIVARRLVRPDLVA